MSASGLGAFLRERRARLVPPADGPSPPSRRRTPGLRREEVAARAGVSVTWYTWLEQGRGGPPSAEVIDRLARALDLDRTDREMLYLLAQQRPPPVGRVAIAPVPASLQAVLDAISVPAFVKTATWDIVAWNQPMTALNDFGKRSARDRNVLRRTFLDPANRGRGVDWEGSARAAVAIFRMDVARMGGSPEASALEAELTAASEDFRRMWADHDVRVHGAGPKRVQHPAVGALGLVSSAFSVEGAEGLSLVVFTAETSGDRPVLERLIAGKGRPRGREATTGPTFVRRRRATRNMRHESASNAPNGPRGRRPRRFGRGPGRCQTFLQITRLGSRLVRAGRTDPVTPPPKELVSGFSSAGW